MHIYIYICHQSKQSYSFWYGDVLLTTSLIRKTVLIWTSGSMRAHPGLKAKKENSYKGRNPKICSGLHMCMHIHFHMYMHIHLSTHSYSWTFTTHSGIHIQINLNNPSAEETELEGSRVQGHSQLCSKFEDSLGYMTFYLKERKNTHQLIF